MARAGGGDRKLPETQNDEARDEATPKITDVAFSEAGGAAVAAILHLLRLVSAELVLTRGLSVATFEEAARKKIDEFTSPATHPQAREAGLAFAHHLLEQVLTQIRAQAEVKKSLGTGDEKLAAAAHASPLHSKFLN